MTNTISKATIFQKALDQQVLAGATSSWMEENSGQVIYNGGDTVKIPVITTNGLGNYDRNNGYAGGAVDLKYQTYSLTQDRSRSFILDAMDVNEANFVPNATAVMSVFQKENVIPEIDAYRYSSLIAKLTTVGVDKAEYGYVPNKETIVAKLKAHIDNIKDVAGDVDLVITMSRLALSELEKATRLERVQFSSNNIVSEVASFDGCPIIPVPSARMKSAYVFKDGKTTGQETGGFAPASNAVDANWIITPKTGPMAISKTEKPKIIDPETNQDADAWKIAYRKFHDCWLTDNKANVSYCCLKQAKPST